jgi:beta-alanine degradation protein BauB
MVKELEPVGTRLIYQDADVRIWALELAPGEETSVHEHQCDYVYVVVEGSTTRVAHSNGKRGVADDSVGQSFFRKAGSVHSLKNIGKGRYLNIVVELLSTEGAEQDG